MKKKHGIRVYSEMNGCCAYCGNEITFKQMQVDHIFPKNRQHWLKNEVVRETHNLDFTDINDPKNLVASCARCNRYKGDWLLEEFRNEISKQVKRARKNSWNFRCAEDYGLIKETNVGVAFYFEKQQATPNVEAKTPQTI